MIEIVPRPTDGALFISDGAFLRSGGAAYVSSPARAGPAEERLVRDVQVLRGLPGRELAAAPALQERREARGKGALRAPEPDAAFFCRGDALCLGDVAE